MRDPVNFDTARFGGRVYVRDGWRWVPASLADLDFAWREEMRRRADRRDMRIAFALAALAVAVTIVRQAFLG